MDAERRDGCRSRSLARVGRCCALAVIMPAMLLLPAGCGRDTTCPYEPEQPVRAPNGVWGPFCLFQNVQGTFRTAIPGSDRLPPIQYRFDWGDGTFSEWSEADTASHVWASAGTYEIRAQARYEANMLPSDWTPPMELRVSRQVAGDGMSFLFRKGSGDCPAGCIINHFFYFVCSPDTCLYLGAAFSRNPQPPPVWWDDAMVGWTCWRRGECCMYGYWPDDESIASTPREDEEAEEAALRLSGNLVAPQVLYEDILLYLSTIREQYGDSIPEVLEVHFDTRWPTGSLVVGLTDEAFEQYQQGQYHDLDSLNTALGLVSCEGYYRTSLRLEFEGRLHPDRLAELYEAVPSVVSAWGPGVVGDASTIVPWVVEAPSE